MVIRYLQYIFYPIVRRLLAGSMLRIPWKVGHSLEWLREWPQRDIREKIRQEHSQADKRRASEGGRDCGLVFWREELKIITMAAYAIFEMVAIGKTDVCSNVVIMAFSDTCFWCLFSMFVCLVVS